MKPHQILLATLLGALASTAVQAQSSVTMFGLIDASVASRELSGGARSNQVSDGGMGSSTFGFRGVEDLGGGLRAQFELSGFFNADNGASGRFGGDTLFSRNARIGLAGAWGAVDAGRMSTPYFLSLIMFNPFGDSPLYSPIFLHTYTGGQFPISSPPLNGSPTSTGPDSGVSNAVKFTTPVMGGVVASLLYAPGEVAGDSSRRRLMGNVNYHAGPLAASFVFERDRMSFANPTETQQHSYMGGLAYDFGVLKLFGQVAQTRQESRLANGGRKITTTQLGVAVPIGLGKVLASWARSNFDLPPGVSPYTVVPGFPAPPAGAATSGVDPRRDTVSVGYDYFLSKRTDVYATIMLDKYTGLSNGKSVATGIRHRF